MNGARNNGKSCLGTLIASAGLIVSSLWILNFSAGIFFEIPDNIPIIGNLDEAFFTMVFLASLSYFGIEIPFLRNRLNASGRIDGGSQKK